MHVLIAVPAKIKLSIQAVTAALRLDIGEQLFYYTLPANSETGVLQEEG
jgi:hypothetical protein